MIDFLAEASAIESALIALRREIHRHPELGRHEKMTAQLVEREFAKLDIPFRRAADTGVVGELTGALPGPTVALRADMDALPVSEKTGLSYASENDGVMHACGHDCHMAMLLGAARILMDVRGQLRGEVRLIFQPAEENACGARDMIAAGAIEGVDAIFGQHVWSEVDAGTFSCEPGARMGNTDWFRIDVEGVSAHGSMPHKGVDAIVIACEIVDALQLIVSRGSSPFEPVVVTVGEIHGGTARNIMAGSAYITGTVRTWNQEVRDSVPRRIERICDKLAHAFGAEITLDYKAGNPAVVNDEEMSGIAANAVRRTLGADALGQYQGTLSGEDFAEYLQHVPGVFVFTGIRNPDIGAVHPQHSGYYLVDENVLAPGASLAAQWAVDMLA